MICFKIVVERPVIFSNWPQGTQHGDGSSNDEKKRPVDGIGLVIVIE